MPRKPRKVSHSLLDNAKANKKDEFYTQYCDIERELVHYEEHFKGKVVYCNCDDPRVSNFFKYFKNNFQRLGLKKLICSFRVPTANDQGTVYQGYYYEYSEGDHSKASLLSNQPNSLISSPISLTLSSPLSSSNSACSNATQSLSLDSMTALKGDGDFRSDECRTLMEKADIMVTNPPFSLFRAMVAQIVELKKDFLLIGNINAITYQEIFKLIQNNQAWLGINLGRGISGFIVPKEYELYGTEARINEQGERIVATNNCLWLTNLNHQQRKQKLNLTKTYQGHEELYPKYLNYDAINVDKTSNIPIDYDGEMGVPITFLHKFNPEQFTIVRFRKGDDNKDLALQERSVYFRIIIKRNDL